MSAPLVIAIWISSLSVYQVAVPFAGHYREREFANSEQGIDDFVVWLQSSKYDKVDLYCIGILDAESTAVAKFFRSSPPDKALFVNPLQVETYAKDQGIKQIGAQTLAAVCTQMLQRTK